MNTGSDDNPNAKHQDGAVHNNDCQPLIIVLMGVCGSGKTTVGELLAQRCGILFHDGDKFHSAANVDKMRRGIPLTDADRAGWLTSLNQHIQTCVARRQNSVVACSALKQMYRDCLRGPDGQKQHVRFVYLKGSFEVLRQRLLTRQGHFMPPEMLNSQFEALEEPQDALVVDVQLPAEEVVRQIEKTFGLTFSAET